MNSKGNILVVDDSHELLNYIIKLLQDEGYTAFPADSGELALASLEIKTPDLMLLDLVMSGVSGFDVCRIVKANKNFDFPIIFLSGATSVKDRIEGLQLGAADFITKPFEREELLIRVKMHLDLYNYHKMFRKQTAQQLLEKEKMLSAQNLEYKKLNDKLNLSNQQIVQMNTVLQQKNEETSLMNENLYETNEKLNNVIKLLKEREIQLEKLNADKNRFISVLAHDLKSPFNAILGFLNLLTKNIRKYDIDKIESQITLIHQSTRNTYNLLEDLLMWAKSNSGKLPFEPSKLDFLKICTEIVNNYKITASAKNIAINFFATCETNIFADRNMLNTILRNLISNAIKFTNPGGNINVSISNFESSALRQAQCGASLTSDNLKIENSKNTKNNFQIDEFSNFQIITVADNGVGIEDDLKHKLFEISQINSTDGTAGEQGTGLGLLLCKEFVTKHGGKIWVESEVGKEANLNLQYPLSN